MNTLILYKHEDDLYDLYDTIEPGNPVCVVQGGTIEDCIKYANRAGQNLPDIQMDNI